mgnify:FL=1|tara:strand:- start:552 stop:770 length:219 start_codon:yes stop_codon:yes gene_type:complete
MDYEQLKKEIFDKIYNDCPKDFYFENELITEYRDVMGHYYRVFATKNENETILTRQYLGSNCFSATLTKLLT